MADDADDVGDDLMMTAQMVTVFAGTAALAVAVGVVPTALTAKQTGI